MAARRVYYGGGDAEYRIFNPQAEKIWSCLASDDQRWTVSDTVLDLGELTQGASIYCAVQNLDGWVCDATEISFTLEMIKYPATAIRGDVVQESYTAINCSPNPFNPCVNIMVSGWKAGSELMVFGVNGKVAASLTQVLNRGTIGTGQRQIVWNASGFASGVYLVMLKNGKTELTRKIILIQ